MSGLELLQIEAWKRFPIRHAFTTRQGGVSEGPYASLNLSWSRGDEKAKVEDNRARVTKALGVERLVFLNQVHSATVIKVDAVPEERWSAGEGDALITNVPGLALCAQTADCVPILIYDPVNKAAAAIHSGWRGTLQNIIAETLKAMAAAYGTQAQQVYAAIGPYISKEKYRVGPEVLEQFKAQGVELNSDILTASDEEGGAGLDVGRICFQQLLAAGLSPGAIASQSPCTFDNSTLFFSCRRAKAEGHGQEFGGQCGIICLA